MDRGAWQARLHGVAKSRTRLKRLSMHAPPSSVTIFNSNVLKLPTGLFLIFFFLLIKILEFYGSIGMKNTNRL